METAIANIMRGKSSTEEMSDEVGRGKCETTGGTAIRKGPTKLRIRLVLESMPEADSQITGKIANVIRPGTALKAPFRVNQRATKSKIGIARPAPGANRSQGTNKQLRNRMPWRKTPVTNNQFWIKPGQRVGAAIARPAMMSVSGNSQTANRARGVSFLKKRAAARKNGCSLKSRPFVGDSRTNYYSTRFPKEAPGVHYSPKEQQYDGPNDPTGSLGQRLIHILDARWLQCLYREYLGGIYRIALGCAAMCTLKDVQ